jgi:dihydroorotate dehydrogenase
MLYEHLVRRVLFAMDPEDAHLRTMRLLALTSPALGVCAPVFRVRDERLRVEAFGLQFPAPVGVAAGLDKDAEASAAWATLGAGFVEVGTVTPRPQEGNPRPRLFRLVEDRALVNRMGFNSAGAEGVARRLERAGPRSAPLGVNVGKNRETPNESAADDYRRAIAVLAPFADYLAINVSSPNTPGLRDLQRPAAVHALVCAAVASANERPPRRPVLVKLSPDLAGEEMDETVDAIVSAGADGIIATNTTLVRDGLHSPLAAETGGLSGAPLRERANEACRRIYRRTAGKVPIVGVGGIFTARDAYERIRSGATLLQVYTSLIYEGPALFRRIHRGLLALLDRDRLSRLVDAVGADAS